MTRIQRASRPLLVFGFAVGLLLVSSSLLQGASSAPTDAAKEEVDSAPAAGKTPSGVEQQHLSSERADLGQRKNQPSNDEADDDGHEVHAELGRVRQLANGLAPGESKTLVLDHHEEIGASNDGHNESEELDKVRIVTDPKTKLTYRIVDRVIEEAEEDAEVQTSTEVPATSGVKDVVGAAEAVDIVAVPELAETTTEKATQAEAEPIDDGAEKEETEEDEEEVEPEEKSGGKLVEGKNQKKLKPEVESEDVALKSLEAEEKQSLESTTTKPDLEEATTTAATETEADDEDDSEELENAEEPATEDSAEPAPKKPADPIEPDESEVQTTTSAPPTDMPSKDEGKQELSGQPTGNVHHSITHNNHFNFGFNPNQLPQQVQQPQVIVLPNNQQPQVIYVDKQTATENSGSPTQVQVNEQTSVASGTNKDKVGEEESKSEKSEKKVIELKDQDDEEDQNEEKPVAQEATSFAPSELELNVKSGGKKKDQTAPSAIISSEGDEEEDEEVAVAVTETEPEVEVEATTQDSNEAKVEYFGETPGQKTIVETRSEKPKGKIVEVKEKEVPNSIKVIESSPTTEIIEKRIIDETSQNSTPIVASKSGEVHIIEERVVREGNSSDELKLKDGGNETKIVKVVEEAHDVDDDDDDDEIVEIEEIEEHDDNQREGSGGRSRGRGRRRGRGRIGRRGRRRRGRGRRRGRRG